MHKHLLICLPMWLLLLPVGAQTVTVKLSGNPVIYYEEVIPVSAVAGVEVGISRRSSVQLSGLYRSYGGLHGDPGNYGGASHGTKGYLDYRFYLFARKQPNGGLYVSPYLGAGKVALTEADLPMRHFSRREVLEKEAGILLGYQPFHHSRFSIDLYAGPAYQRRTLEMEEPNGNLISSSMKRPWFRGGLSLCYRISRQNYAQRRQERPVRSPRLPPTNE
jgi:hypothetical protein